MRGEISVGKVGPLSDGQVEIDYDKTERGADPKRAAADGMTFGKMLMDHGGILDERSNGRRGSSPHFGTGLRRLEILRQPK
jgi:hypothetical protein